MKPLDGWDGVEFAHDDPAAVLPPLGPARSYRVLTWAEIESQRQSAIDRIADSLAVDHDCAESLLCAHRWRYAAVIDAYLDDDGGADGARPSAAADADAVVVCGSAFCGRYPRAQTTALACGHSFCNDCWRAFASSEMASGRAAINIRCPGVDCDDGAVVRKCRLKIPSGVFMRFLDAGQIGRYRRWLVDDFVSGSESLRWCIRPSCDRAISCANPNEVVTCHCRTTFCFGAAVPE